MNSSIENTQATLDESKIKKKTIKKLYIDIY